MALIRTVLNEVFGLFVDDGSLAGAIVAWLLLVAVLLPMLGVAPNWTGIILFVGLVVILLENTIRRARQ
ncbi:hypothetical protein [Rhodopila sp.]|uniref:hypothetical protein n=1 Tax=Rhodopila sp. TaxID=2480087 RepID=UPI003D0B0977